MKLNKYMKSNIEYAITKAKREETTKVVAEIQNEYINKCTVGLYQKDLVDTAVKLGPEWYSERSNFCIRLSAKGHNSNFKALAVSGYTSEPVIGPRSFCGDIYIPDGTAAADYHKSVVAKIEELEANLKVIVRAVEERLEMKTTDKALKESWPEIAKFVDDVVNPLAYRATLPCVTNDEINKALGL